MLNQHTTKNLLILLPTFGILIFIGLYFYAASLYPGGSQADINSVGFSWANNYWCNLLSENGMNGLENPARPIAILALIILCSSFALFFFLFATHFVKNGIWKTTIKISGSTAMMAAVFIFTRYHDIMTTILSVFGVLVIIGIIRTIYISNLTFFKIMGLVCIIGIGINNLIYYSGNLIEYLPLIQKTNFVLVFGWTIGLNLKMKSKNVLQQSI